MTFEKTLETYVETKNKSNEFKTSFIKQVLLMSTTLLGILISLHDKTINSTCTQIAFSVTLILLSLGILLLSIGLYEQVHSHNKLALDYWEEFRKHASDITYNPKIIVQYPLKIYLLCQKYGYVSLMISVISLTIYGILIA
ncbi:MAG: hypothetical protein A2W91_17290 [Bacteroidetes bacterium GWF2_38_335]|nr:MAG: hypothetical protein A2W91_17290 [Bacteroidetes bacterium GWF2_38_335]OFY79562.1 MAG: hypothetical protein A2281_14115 [Bacteroidetes bacterium RIFOXYA12_FULL_38_20]HBS87332.1 hypothetical protein [Bacteroidales bacterium]